MAYTGSVNAAIIQQWLAAKLNLQAIEEELIAKGFDTDAIKAYISEFKKMRNARKQFTGFACMGIGALLGFVSIVLTLMNPQSHLYNFFLYGLTSMAVLIVFLGLYFIFE